MIAVRMSRNQQNARGPGHSNTHSRRRIGLVALLASLCAFALPTAPAFGEGSVDVNIGPDAATRHGMAIGNPAPSIGFRSVPQVYAQAGETIQMAHSVMGFPNANIQVYAPGDDPATATPVLDCAASQAGSGRIASRAEEVAGPLPNAGGYDPCEFVATADGIYSIVMRGTTSDNGHPGTVATPNVGAGQGRTASIWDVTVRDAGGAVQPGRAFSQNFQFRTTGTLADASNFQAYTYTKTGYEYQVNLTQHAGLNWALRPDDVGMVDSQTGERLFASFACGDESDPAVDRPCIFFEAEQGQGNVFPVFFNQVDPLVITGPGGLGATLGYSDVPISPGSNPLANAAFTGSAGQSGATDQGSGGTIAFSSSTQMVGLGYTLAIDIDRNGTFGDGSDLVDASGDLSASGSNTFAWNGRDGAGAVPACGEYPYQIRSTLSEVHFPMFDVENSGGTQIQRLSLPADPELGDPFAASYNNVDPYKTGQPTDPRWPTGGVVTNGTPQAVTTGDSSFPGFNSWSDNTGNTDWIDTWSRLPEVQTTGMLRIVCPSVPPLSERPKVTIDKTVSAPRVRVGQMVTFQMVAKNNGPGVATNVKVDDNVPSRLDARSASSAQGSCSVTGNKVHCELGTMAVGQEVTISVRARAIRSGHATNTATVDSESCTTHPCDDDPAKVTIVKPKLKLTKQVGKRTLRAGQTTSYTIRVSNPSKVALRNVRTCDRLPAGLVYVSSKPKAKVSGGRHCWTTKRLAGGASKTYRVTVRALRGTSGRKVNTATATSPDAKRAQARRAVRVIAGGLLPDLLTG